MDVFDTAEWHEIDDQIVTELHNTVQILPCAFPHAEYLRENYVKYPNNERVKAPKTIKTPTTRQRICPADDADLITKKIEIVKSKKNNRMKHIKRLINRKKTLKRSKRRAAKAMETKARAAETKEFELTKKLLMATMDQYSTVTGASVVDTTVQNRNAGSTSIATRTRNQSKTNTPEKSTRPLRRTSLNKTYCDKK